MMTNENNHIGRQEIEQQSLTNSERIIPVAREEVVIAKREVETGHVVVNRHTATEVQEISVPVSEFTYEEHRVPMNVVVAEMPATRQEADRVVIPVVREEIVTLKRLVLVEEVHLIKKATEHTHTETVELQTQQVTVTRD